MSSSPEFRKPKRFSGKTLARYSVKGFILFVLPLALIPATIFALGKGNLVGIIVNATGFTAYMLAAVCLRKGLQEEYRYLNSHLAQPPKIPFKLLAALLVGGTTGMVSWLGAEQTIAVAIIYAGGAWLGVLLSYGFDPRKQKQQAGAHGYSGDEIFQMLEESASIIRSIEVANDAIYNAELTQRIKRICSIADNILADLEANPRDIRRARKFLTVYLDGARQVTEGYARTHQQTQSDELEENFRHVLETIESVFKQQKQKLLEDDVFDLDVKIEVLDTQLKREGIP